MGIEKLSHLTAIPLRRFWLDIPPASRHPNLFGIFHERPSMEPTVGVFTLGTVENRASSGSITGQLTGQPCEEHNLTHHSIRCH